MSQCGWRAPGAFARSSRRSRARRSPHVLDDTGLFAADWDVRVRRDWGSAAGGLRAPPRRPQARWSISSIRRAERCVDDVARARRPRAPSGSAPARIASPIALEAAFRSAFRRSASPSRAPGALSTASARSTTDGSSPLSIAPWRMTSGSSRSRWAPTLTSGPPRPGRAGGPAPLRRPRRAADRRSRDPGSRAASRHAARSAVPGTRRRAPRTHARRAARLLATFEDQRLPRVAAVRALALGARARNAAR